MARPLSLLNYLVQITTTRANAGRLDGRVPYRFGDFVRGHLRVSSDGGCQYLDTVKRAFTQWRVLP